jgi:hypothetical protein
VVGVYETYDGLVVTLLDEPQATCPDPNHTKGNQIPDPDLADVARAVKIAAPPESLRRR